MSDSGEDVTHDEHTRLRKESRKEREITDDRHDLSEENEETASSGTRTGANTPEVSFESKSRLPYEPNALEENRVPNTYRNEFERPLSSTDVSGELATTKDTEQLSSSGGPTILEISRERNDREKTHAIDEALSADFNDKEVTFEDKQLAEMDEVVYPRRSSSEDLLSKSTSSISQSISKAEDIVPETKAVAPVEPELIGHTVKNNELKEPEPGSQPQLQENVVKEQITPVLKQEVPEHTVSEHLATPQDEVDVTGGIELSSSTPVHEAAIEKAMPSVEESVDVAHGPGVDPSIFKDPDFSLVSNASVPPAASAPDAPPISPANDAAIDESEPNQAASNSELTIAIEEDSSTQNVQDETKNPVTSSSSEELIDDIKPTDMAQYTPSNYQQEESNLDGPTPALDEGINNGEIEPVGQVSHTTPAEGTVQSLAPPEDGNHSQLQEITQTSSEVKLTGEEEALGETLSEKPEILPILDEEQSVTSLQEAHEPIPDRMDERARKEHGSDVTDSDEVLSEESVEVTYPVPFISQDVRLPETSAREADKNATAKEQTLPLGQDAPILHAESEPAAQEKDFLEPLPSHSDGDDIREHEPKGRESSGSSQEESTEDSYLGHSGTKDLQPSEGGVLDANETVEQQNLPRSHEAPEPRPTPDSTTDGVGAMIPAFASESPVTSKETTEVARIQEVKEEEASPPSLEPDAQDSNAIEQQPAGGEVSPVSASDLVPPPQSALLDQEAQNERDIPLLKEEIETDAPTLAGLENHQIQQLVDAPVGLKVETVDAHHGSLHGSQSEASVFPNENIQTDGGEFTSGPAIAKPGDETLNDDGYPSEIQERTPEDTNTPHTLNADASLNTHTSEDEPIPLVNDTATESHTHPVEQDIYTVEADTQDSIVPGDDFILEDSSVLPGESSSSDNISDDSGVNMNSNENLAISPLDDAIMGEGLLLNLADSNNNVSLPASNAEENKPHTTNVAPTLISEQSPINRDIDETSEDMKPLPSIMAPAIPGLDVLYTEESSNMLAPNTIPSPSFQPSELAENTTAAASDGQSCTSAHDEPKSDRIPSSHILVDLSQHVPEITDKGAEKDQSPQAPEGITSLRECLDTSDSAFQSGKLEVVPDLHIESRDQAIDLITNAEELEGVSLDPAATPYESPFGQKSLLKQVHDRAFSGDEGSLYAPETGISETLSKPNSDVSAEEGLPETVAEESSESLEKTTNVSQKVTSSTEQNPEGMEEPTITSFQGYLRDMGPHLVKEATDETLASSVSTLIPESTDLPVNSVNQIQDSPNPLAAKQNGSDADLVHNSTPDVSRVEASEDGILQPLALDEMTLKTTDSDNANAFNIGVAPPGKSLLVLDDSKGLKESVQIGVSPSHSISEEQAIHIEDIQSTNLPGSEMTPVAIVKPLQDLESLPQGIKTDLDPISTPFTEMSDVLVSDPESSILHFQSESGAPFINASVPVEEDEHLSELSSISGTSMGDHVSELSSIPSLATEIPEHTPRMTSAAMRDESDDLSSVLLTQVSMPIHVQGEHTISPVSLELEKAEDSYSDNEDTIDSLAPEAPLTPRSDLGIHSPSFDSRSEISAASHVPTPPRTPRSDPLASIEPLSLSSLLVQSLGTLELESPAELQPKLEESFPVSSITPTGESLAIPIEALVGEPTLVHDRHMADDEDIENVLPDNGERSDLQTSLIHDESPAEERVGDIQPEGMAFESTVTQSETKEDLKIAEEVTIVSLPTEHQIHEAPIVSLISSPPEAQQEGLREDLLPIHPAVEIKAEETVTPSPVGGILSESRESHGSEFVDSSNAIIEPKPDPVDDAVAISELNHAHSASDQSVLLTPEILEQTESADAPELAPLRMVVEANEPEELALPGENSQGSREAHTAFFEDNKEIGIFSDPSTNSIFTGGAPENVSTELQATDIAVKASSPKQPVDAEPSTSLADHSSVMMDIPQNLETEIAFLPSEGPISTEANDTVLFPSQSTHPFPKSEVSERSPRIVLSSVLEDDHAQVEVVAGDKLSPLIPSPKVRVRHLSAASRMLPGGWAFSHQSENHPSLEVAAGEFVPSPRTPVEEKKSSKCTIM